MKISALILPFLALAMAAPSPGRGHAVSGDDVPADLKGVFRIVGDVVVGPGGYFDSTGFHEGEYHGKRELEARFLLTWKLLKLKGWKFGHGGLNPPGGGCWGSGGWGSCGGGGGGCSGGNCGGGGGGGCESGNCGGGGGGCEGGNCGGGGGCESGNCGGGGGGDGGHGGGHGGCKGKNCGKPGW
ncbi:hypothetical protein CcaverHIS002_0503090 [Cutaneotrichosporon cavernicola]|uniref:Uncharacterized protein n=1 Tax=Cutaneotrichosporon cavernicola TaxID=279322 RepID=A0AA48L6A8_9TREE|nr:uncharacterized protein CcaverHIS019_0503660 [Cutaneotrichosporon cavernicola]BEI84908.1 hypothetical protein CcaverHIS002_0503090 [Cutaneotrichosporon cavernicola]BEI92738.1 hypothetical protein CcaverHIS019_0503660 [Cutaneotrichosporon cavernicola]BEJ00515.1 hypothetical protein CcaverHIS631_0503720 [Cutaneotrichosporon cavernicola]BEJ08284.1 hypothetical protein CcaverHIS641_0503690 [Cutaneotrichosporon cavernicola]